MTCYTNCIHCETCDIADDMEYEDAEIMKSDCPHFKNKADFVEVVRCKDCNRYKPYNKPVEDFDGWCIARECETDENEFCSYGERRGTNG